jgi:pyruvate-formate lyase-activating enzyme
MSRARRALPMAVVAGERGEVREVPGVAAAQRRGARHEPVDPDELVPLPAGSLLFALPGRVALGFTPERGLAPLSSEEGDGNRVAAGAVAAFPPPGFSLFGLASYASEPGAPLLPLHAYGAVCLYDDVLHVPMARVEADVKHDPAQFDETALPRLVATLQQRFPRNRLVAHLGDNCALRYGCANAKNLFHERWEAPVALAPACNAACVGCISAQPDSPIPSPQERLAFVPTVDEVVEFGVPHLESAPRAMLSFGQGCEGEPLMQAELLLECVRALRKRTARGTLHLNTNGSRPDVVARLCDAGLDSIRVSTNSARREPYHAYYRPLGYGFDQVVESLAVARARGRFTSINCLSFPGFTDSDEEVAALEQLIGKVELGLIQWRNLNIDPELYVEVVGLSPETPARGMRRLLADLQRRFPSLRHGYVNPPRETFEAARA